MSVEINEKDRLFVLKSGDGYSCLGFDVVFDYCKVLEEMMALEPQAVESDIGTEKQYQHYIELIGKAKGKNLGTFFRYRTPKKVQRILESYRKNGGKLRIFYGDKTGRDWLEENEVIGEIGRSTGTLKIPLLLSENDDGSRGSGGCPVMDDCIVKIVDVRTFGVLYEAENYHMPKMDIRKNEHSEYGVYVEGSDGVESLHASFKNLAKAAQFVAFVAGENMQEP